MKKILVFGRRRHFDRVYDVANGLYGDCIIDLWSDENHGRVNVHWFGNYFYKEYADSILYPFVPEKSEIYDIIQRCRFLRYKDKDIAVRCVLSALSSWIKIIENNSYDEILSLPVDSFIIDTLIRSAQFCGIKILFPVTTPFKGRIRFSCRGELRGITGTKDQFSEEIEKSILDIGQQNYRAEVLMGVNTKSSMTIFRRYLIDSLKTPAFAFYRLLKNDPMSFSFPPRKYLLHRMFGTSSRALRAITCEKISTINIPDGHIFIPLQFYPESTTDYWVPELSMCDHHDVVMKIVDSINGKYPIVIKEHPAAIGRRDSRFLDYLIEKNVTFAPLLLPTGLIMQNAALVIGAGTTTMLQAMLNKIPVLFTGTPFYGASGRNILKTINDSNEIINQIEDSIGRKYVNGQSELSLINYFLSSSPGRLGSYKIFGERSISQEFVVEIPLSTRTFYQSL